MRCPIAVALVACSLLPLSSVAVAQSDAIRLNQVGFYPEGPKVAVVFGFGEASFEVRPAEGGEAVLMGTLDRGRIWAPSGETARQADFSALTTPGTYIVEVPDVGTSYPFEIREAVHEPIARAALKGYFFQRVSTALEAEYAGPWARAAGHPDTQVVIHPSAATDSRPAGSTISSPGGWYDAGDYNKYIVNSGISVGTLLSAYEWNPDYLSAFDVNIPESENEVPDILDEALWNIRWMLTMQDEDGGVYHKLTTANFSGEIMPASGRETRYVVQKGTAATLDFAAVMAQAARVFEDFPEAFPGFADELRAAALDAWSWARANPSVQYSQSALNAAYDPDINTGEYGDGNFEDEFDWAAMELYLTTRADSFLTATSPLDPVQLGVPGWPSVRELGYHSLLVHRDEVGADVDTARIRSALLSLADGLVQKVEQSGYGVTMTSGDFYWGSNSVAANHGVALVLAHRITGDTRYLDAATAALDYLLGRNATGYAFLTGFGERSPRHPHHRPSQADGVADPVPGLLAGGPHAGGQDIGSQPWECDNYRSTPAASYLDDWCSYATNEITINWNAPLVHLAVSVEAARSQTGLPTAFEPDGGAEERGVGLGIHAAPNPFRGATSLRVKLAAPTTVTVRLFDVLGREVRQLLGEVRLAAGDHAVALDGQSLAPGVYVVRVESADFVASRTVTIVR